MSIVGIDEESDVCELLIRQEEAVACLHEAYAACLPGLAGMWSQLATEERAHARVLKVIAEMTCNGHISSARSFQSEAINANIEFIQRQTSVTLSKGTTHIAALSIALSIEECIIENQFLSAFEIHTASIEAEFRALNNHTVEHRAKVRACIAEERQRLRSAAYAFEACHAVA